MFYFSKIFFYYSKPLTLYRVKCIQQSVKKWFLNKSINRRFFSSRLIIIIGTRLICYLNEHIHRHIFLKYVHIFSWDATRVRLSTVYPGYDQYPPIDWLKYTKQETIQTAFMTFWISYNVQYWHLSRVMWHRKLGSVRFNRLNSCEIILQTVSLVKQSNGKQRFFSDKTISITPSNGSQ